MQGFSSLTKPLFWAALMLLVIWGKGRFGCVPVPEGVVHMQPAVKENRREFCRFGVPIQRGDICRFEASGQRFELFARVVAIEGDTISMAGGQLFVNGEKRVEPYVTKPDKEETLQEMICPAGCVYVLNDVRGTYGSAARDSRFLGPISAYDVTAVIRD